MGAWGYGPFDNDAAMDFVGELPGEPSAELRAAMTEVVESDEYLDGPDVDAAIAAACLVAARADPSLTIDASAGDYLGKMAFTVDEGLRALAARVFVRAFEPSDNEWYDLWEDAGALGEVVGILRAFREGVRGG